MSVYTTNNKNCQASKERKPEMETKVETKNGEEIIVVEKAGVRLALTKEEADELRQRLFLL